MKTIRWGILGPGRIARKFAADLRLVEDTELIAVGARSRQSAEDFNKTFPVKYVHDSYEALAQNPEVDVIYDCYAVQLSLRKYAGFMRAARERFCAKSLSL